MTRIVLSKQEYLRSGDGPDCQNDRPVAYEVHGMPPGQEAHLIYFAGIDNDQWTILLSQNGVLGDGYGEYKTADEAVASLEENINQSAIRTVGALRI